MKIVSIDTETTGLCEDTCDIIEFGAVMDDLAHPEIAYCSLPKFHCYFIKDQYEGQPYALSMHPHIFRRIADREEPYIYTSAMKFGNMFKKFLIKNGIEEKHDKVTINVAGKNFGIFDYQFLKRKTDMCKHVKMRHKMLDPAMLYMKIGDESLPGLEECKRRAGLPPEVTHNALDDAMDVVKLMRIGIKKNGIS